MIDVFRLLANMPELVRVNGMTGFTSDGALLIIVIIVIILIILIILINSLNSLPKDKETYKK